MKKALFPTPQDDLEDIVRCGGGEDWLFSDSLLEEVFPLSPPLESHLQSESFWTLRINSVERSLEHLLLHATILNTRICCSVTLKDQWTRLEVSSGTIVNLVFTEWSGNLVVDHVNNYLIVHPERLLSITMLADAFACKRKASLSMLYAQAAEECQINSAIIVGSVIHELFEGRLKGREHFGCPVG